jgi:pimeloyl-ACP methyl ester carboxylesterase
MLTTTSKDGTPIPYCRTVSPTSSFTLALIIVHGTFEFTNSHPGLISFLSNHYTVITYNRRGRGDNPSYGENYSIATEVADLHAVITTTAARYIFGVGTGALICLQTAREYPDLLEKVILFEPVLYSPETAEKDLGFVKRCASEMQGGKLAAAMVTAMLGMRMWPNFLRLLPRCVLVWMMGRMMEKQEKEVEASALISTENKTGSDEKGGFSNIIVLQMYASTLGYHFQLVKEMARPVKEFSIITAEVLLLQREKSPAYLRECLPKLETVLDKVKSVELPKLRPGLFSFPLRSIFY